MDMEKSVMIAIVTVVVIAAAVVVTDNIDSIGNIPPGSAWNPTENPGIYTGADLMEALWWWLVLGAIMMMIIVALWNLCVTVNPSSIRLTIYSAARYRFCRVLPAS